MTENYVRKRSIAIAFRVMPEDNRKINEMVKLSGLTKQDYLRNNMLHQQIVVQGNPRVFKALRGKMDEIISELKRIENGDQLDEASLNTIMYVVDLYARMIEQKEQKGPEPDCGPGSCQYRIRSS